VRTYFVRSVTVLVAGVAFAACGETDPIPSELTEAEAEDLAGVLMLATFDATSGESGLAPAGPAATPYTYDASLSTDVQCPLGGVVAVTADVTVEGDTESEAATVDYSMTQVHDGCGVVSENDREFTLWGAPGLELDLLVASNGLGVVEWGGTVTGAIDWETDGREGTCEVALEFEARLEVEVSLDASLAGVVCGFDVSRTFSVS
jgi:hypothetical protein